MSQTAENDPEQFLATLPDLMRRYLEHDWSCLADPSFSREDVSQFCEWLQDKEPDARREYERLLRHDRIKWNEYCQKAQQLEKSTLSLFRIAPKGMPGRKMETELAERIWKLRAEGKTVFQIQEIFRAEGQHRSKEQIESYLKTRRRSPQR